MLSIESQVNSLQARLADAASQRRQIEDDLNVSEILIFFIFLGTLLNIKNGCALLDEICLHLLSSCYITVA